MINKGIDPPGSAIDEALWAAYRRDDKTAVMDYLFGRVWSGKVLRDLSPASGQRPLKKSFVSRRANGGPVLINTGSRVC